MLGDGYLSSQVRWVLVLTWWWCGAAVTQTAGGPCLVAKIISPQSRKELGTNEYNQCNLRLIDSRQVNFCVSALPDSSCDDLAVIQGTFCASDLEATSVQKKLSYPSSRHVPQELKSSYFNDTRVYSSTVSNSQVLETAYTPINR